MVARKTHVVHLGGIGTITQEALIPRSQRDDRPAPYEGQTSRRAQIGFAADLDRTIVDHNLIPVHGNILTHIEFQEQADNRAVRRIDRKLIAKSGLSAKSIVSLLIG